MVRQGLTVQCGEHERRDLWFRIAWRCHACITVRDELSLLRWR
jgi:hypothetical protein